MNGKFQFRRVCVIGVTASGKTTLAKSLAKILYYDYIELDELFHEPNWIDASREVFCERVEQRMKAERWVCDGYYGNWAGQFDIADLIIYLDYPFRIVLQRVLWRTTKRLLKKEELWNGNYETLKKTFSRESIIAWVFKTYWKRKRDIPRHLALFDAEILRFSHPKEAREWLKNLS